MKNLFALLIAALPLFVQAQISITSSDVPEAGEIITTVECELSPDISVGMAGSNQTYDFSMLEPADTFVLSFVSANGTAGFNEFPNSNLAVETEGDFIYYQKTNDEFILLGFYNDTSAMSIGQYTAVHFTPPSKVFEFPSTYNTSYTNITGFTFTEVDDENPADSFRVTTNLDETILFDGYGTVITPDGSFDGLREKTIATTTTIFETYSSGVWTTVYSNASTDTSYTWFSDNNIGLVSVSIIDGEVVNVSYNTSTPVTTAPIADFSFNNLGNGAVDFSDNSSSLPTSWLWDFGDGNTSPQQNPEHTFAASGTYNVCLTATNSVGSNTFCMDIVISIAPVASFTYTSPSLGIVDFIDASTNNPTSWLWDFGDGNTSTQQNPQYSYATSNTYNVCLTVTNVGGSNTICEMVNVVITGTDDLTNSVGVEVFPNPVHQTLNIRLENVNQETLNFQLVNVLGEAVKEIKVEAIGDYQIDIENFASGMYHYVLQDKDGQVRGTGIIMKGNL